MESDDWRGRVGYRGGGVYLMATFYIDPTVSGTGTGTFGDPYKSWASIAFFAAGNTYLQKAGTTFFGTITVNVGGSSEATRVIVGSYDPVTGAATTNKAFIDASTSGNLRGLRVAGSVNFVTVQDLDIVGGNGVGIRTCMDAGSSGSKANNLKCLRLRLHDVQSSGANVSGGLNFYSDDAVVEDCEIFNIGDDGIYGEGLRPRIWRNRIYDVSQSNNVAGDPIQLNGNCSGFSVCYNDLTQPKYLQQVFICSGASLGSGGLFAHNICRMPTGTTGSGSVKNVFNDQPGVTIQGNVIIGGDHGIWLDGTTPNCRIISNVVMHAWQGIVSNGGTNVIANNTVLYSTDQGFRVFTGGGTPTITNNIAAYCGVGIAAIGTITKTTNCYFSNTTNFLSLGSGGSIEGSAVTQDPRVQSDGGIPASSPVATAGTYVSGVTLANGRLRPNFTPIGAYMAVLPRTARV